jgi:hypothetical protein
MRSPEEMASMTDNDPTGSAPSEEEPTPWPRDEPDDSLLVEEPGYLTESGQAVGEDGSVVPIIGGLPAVEGSSWDIGAPEEDRGAGLAEQQGHASDHGR